LQWTSFSFFVFLGSAAFIYGGWLERGRARARLVVGRDVMLVGGLAIAASESAIHHYVVVARLRGYRRYRALRTRLYLAGVDTIKWFPDRRGMATGMAIMDSRGRVIGAPLADR